MRTLARRVTVGVLGLVTLLLGTVLAAAPAAAAPVPAVQAFGSCLLGRQQGDLLILFDESGSIDRTDSEGARILAAKNLIAQLTADAGATEVDLQVRVAGFGYSYRPAGSWIGLRDPGAGAALDQAIADSTGTDGYETDYWVGLDGARKELQARSAADPGRCQALLWFSDGQFAVRQRDADEVVQYGGDKPYAPGLDLTSEADAREADRLGEEDLCRPTGLANELRAGGITLLGIGLGSTRFELMEKVNENPTGDCGTLTEPAGRFWPVSGFEEVIAAFDEVAHPVATSTRQFVLDDVLTRVHALGRVTPGLSYTLRGPGGGELALADSSRDPVEEPVPGERGVTVRWQWISERLVVIDLERAADARWFGLWTIDIADRSGDPAGQNADPRVSFSADLYPSWSPDNAALLVSGARPGVRLGLARADGADLPVDQVPGRVQVTGSLLDSAGQDHDLMASPTTKDQLRDPVAVDLTGVPPGPATVTLRLDYTTAEVNGLSTTLEAQNTTHDVRVLPPPDRGAITGTLAFGDVEGPADQTARVSVSGPSCVWLSGPPTVLVSPAGVEPVFSSPHSSADTCLRVDRGATADLEVRLTSATEGNDPLTGTVPVQLAPLDDPGRALAQPVPFSAELRKRLDPETAVGAFVAALLAGIGIPLAGLYLAKYLTAKIPGRALEAIRVPVTVHGGQLSRNGSALTLDQLPPPVPVAVSRRGSRRVEAAGVTLRARTGASPFSAGWVEAVLPGHRGASATSGRPTGRQGGARLPLSVHNTWVLFHDPGGPAEQADLLLLRGLDVTDADRRSQLDEAARAVPGLLAGLRPTGGKGAGGSAGPAASKGPGGPAAPAAPGGVSPSGPTGGAAPASEPAAGWSPARGPAGGDTADTAGTSGTGTGGGPPPASGAADIDWTQGRFGAQNPPDDPSRPS